MSTDLILTLQDLMMYTAYSYITGPDDVSILTIFTLQELMMYDYSYITGHDAV